MRWDDQLFSGEHEGWHWRVSRHGPFDVDDIVLQYFEGRHLGIAAYDGGMFVPNPEKIDLGWRSVGGLAVSPPIREELQVPSDEYFEWYFLDSVPDELPEFETFVNFSSFNLADPKEMAATFDPTWEQNALDWLYPLQRRFWQQLISINPAAYVSWGDNQIVVSKETGFKEQYSSAAQPD